MQDSQCVQQSDHVQQSPLFMTSVSIGPVRIFGLLNLDERRRKYLENLKEGKQVDKEIEEQRSKH